MFDIGDREPDELLGGAGAELALQVFSVGSNGFRTDSQSLSKILRKLAGISHIFFSGPVPKIHFFPATQRMELRIIEWSASLLSGWGLMDMMRPLPNCPETMAGVLIMVPSWGL